MNILIQLQAILRQIFDDDELTVSRETTATDIEAWDSVQHVIFILEVEAWFQVQFSLSEIAYIRKMGDLVDLVEKKFTRRSQRKPGLVAS